MQLKINKKIFLSGIQTVSRAISSRTALPILSNILMEAKDNALRLFATDLEIGIETEVEVLELKQPGSVTIPAKLLSELVSNFTKDEINLKTDQKKNFLLIECGDGNYRLNSIPADEFPTLPEIKGGTTIKLKANILKDIIKSTVFAAAPSSEPRVILTGALFEITGNIFRMVATNAHRLILKSVDIGEVENEINTVLPAKSLNEVLRISEDKDEEIEIVASENQVKFKSKPTIIYSRTIEGKFPPYQQAIPSSSVIKWKVKTQDILQSTKRISAIAKEDTNVIKLKTKEGKLQIEALTQDVGFGVDTIDIEQEGENIEIAFNAEYLLDFLSKIESQFINFGLNSSTTAVIITPEETKDYIYIIMPIRTT